jgi:hypothetical protein
MASTIKQTVYKTEAEKEKALIKFLKQIEKNDIKSNNSKATNVRN